MRVHHSLPTARYLLLAVACERARAAGPLAHARRATTTPLLPALYHVSSMPPPTQRPHTPLRCTPQRAPRALSLASQYPAAHAGGAAPHRCGSGSDPLDCGITGDRRHQRAPPACQQQFMSGRASGQSERRSKRLTLTSTSTALCTGGSRQPSAGDHVGGVNPPPSARHV